MSRGLGRVQQAVLTALRQRGGSADIRTLLVDVYYAPQATDDRDAAALQYRVYRRDDKWDEAAYQSIIRAVRRLEQGGLVRTYWQRASSEALVARDEARWKQVYLTTAPGTTLLILPTTWDCWAQQEGYTRAEVIRLTADARQVLEVWTRPTAAHPYVVVLLGLTQDTGPVVLPCLSRPGLHQIKRRIQTVLRQAKPGAIWDATTLLPQLQPNREWLQGPLDPTTG